MTAMTARCVPCPTCKQPTAYEPNNRWRPFCSARCRSVDLGDWGSERFRLVSELEPEEAARTNVD